MTDAKVLRRRLLLCTFGLGTNMGMNARMVQIVLAEPRWQKKLTEADRRALSALFWSHVNLYGKFELDMSKQLDLGPGPSVEGSTIRRSVLSDERSWGFTMASPKSHDGALHGHDRGDAGCRQLIVAGSQHTGGRRGPGFATARASPCRSSGPGTRPISAWSTFPWSPVRRAAEFGPAAHAGPRARRPYGPMVAVRPGIIEAWRTSALRPLPPQQCGWHSRSSSAGGPVGRRAGGRAPVVPGRARRSPCAQRTAPPGCSRPGSAGGSREIQPS
ncbi:Tn3 family transposase [Actinomadura sp. DSM 109109]|nr:Tn3 family transposase [Actinomadura lepetitiana]